MPSPVLAETGNISSLGLRRWAYSTRWVPRAVAQLKEEYPHITVSVISGSPMQVDNWLRDGSVEIGVTDRRWTGAELDWTKLVDDPFLAVLPPDSDAPDPMPADYLSGKAVIIPDYGTNTDTTRVFTRAGVEPAYTDDRLNNRSVLAAVAAGLGSTVFSRLELDYYAQQNLTVRAIDPPCGEAVTMKDGLPVSDRGAGHGYGCLSIQTIARRNGGLCEFSCGGGQFRLQVMLPVLEHRE